MIEHQQLEGIEVSTYNVAKKGNWCSGDAFFLIRTEDYFLCAMADGLGSGEEANEASDAAISFIRTNHHLDVETLMSECNDLMWQKRGAVLTIIKLDMDTQEIIYCNVGNIGCIFYKPSGKLYRPVPSRGYLSGRKQNFRLQKLPFEKGMSFILHSDGLDFDPYYHSLFTRMGSPKFILQRLLDMMEISDDDTTIMVGKIAS